MPGYTAHPQAAVRRIGRSDRLSSDDSFRRDRPEKTLHGPLARPEETSHEKERVMTESRAKPGPKGTSHANKPLRARAVGDSTTASKFRFSATLFRPVATAKAV